VLVAIRQNLRGAAIQQYQQQLVDEWRSVVVVLDADAAQWARPRTKHLPTEYMAVT